MNIGNQCPECSSWLTCECPKHLDVPIWITAPVTTEEPERVRALVKENTELRAELDRLREALRETRVTVERFVDALPRCHECKKPAVMSYPTSEWGYRTLGCEDHPGAHTNEWDHEPQKTQWANALADWGAIKEPTP